MQGRAKRSAYTYRPSKYQKYNLYLPKVTMSDTSKKKINMRRQMNIQFPKSSLYPWRAKGNTFPVLLSPGILALYPTLCIKIAARSKIEETLASLFFSTDNRSKVIFRVTQKALRDFLTYSRKYLALRGCDRAKHKSGVPLIYPLLENKLTLVAYFKVTLQSFRFSPDGRKTIGLSCALRCK